MKAFFTPLKVGVVVLAGLGAFFWMFGQVKEGIDDDASGYRVYAVFKDASGLADKSRVVIAGINVGQIDKVELAGDQAKVWLKVNTPLRSDARIAKKQASLLGEYYLLLTPGYTGQPLKDGDEIKLIDYDVPPADLINELKGITKNVEEITASIKKVVSGQEGEERLVKILENINTTVAEVKRAVTDNGPKVDLVVDNVVQVTQEAVEVTREAKRFVKDFRGDAGKLMANAKAVTEDARAVTAGVRRFVDPGSEGPGVAGVPGEKTASVRDAVSHLESALQNLDKTLVRANSIAAKIDDGQGSIGRLVNDDKLVESVTELVDEGGRFVKRLTRLQFQVAMRGEYYLSQGSVKNYLELRLQPRPDKYYMIQVVDDPKGATKLVETVTATSDSESDPVIRSQESITEDRFRLSLQFAKRFYFATGRIGIMESSGGVGLDFHLFDDALEISNDIFAFSANLNPRFRTRAIYRFFTHLYIAAGVDDVFNDELSDLFVGAGVQFTDDDLSAILATAPTPSL